MLPRPGSISKYMVSHSLFPTQEAEHAWPGRLLLPAPPTAVVPVNWRYHVSPVWEKKGVSSSKNPPPSTERTGPPSQGSQTINSQSLLNNGASPPRFKGKGAPWGVCWLCKEMWVLSSPVDPLLSPSQFSRDTATAMARTLEEVQPPTSSHPCSLTVVYYFACCTKVRNRDTVW